MRRLMVFAVLATTWAVPACADEVPAADRSEIQRVITAQIDAFRHDDGPAALGFAAPGIRSKFGDAAGFLGMVRQAYPPVYRPRAFSFGALAAAGGLTMQKVEIVGPDGVPALAIYDMEHEADGSWRISGCRLVKSEMRET